MSDNGGNDGEKHAFKPIKSIRRMYGLCFNGGWWRWTHQFLLVMWLSLLAATPHKASGYFLGDTKAVLNGCEDHWTLQDRAAMPPLFQMTLCVDIRVVTPGAWVAFSYSSVYAPKPDLGLEGDDEALYGWLLRVRHRFPIRLSQKHWHRVCLRRDVQRNSFSLEVDGKTVAERTAIAQAIPPHGSLWLGCRPRDRPPGAMLGEVELYLFRMWADLGYHGHCEDGTVIGWNAQYWGVTSARGRQRDPDLQCADHRRLRRGARRYRSVTNATITAVGRSLSPSPVPSTATTSSPVIATVTQTSTVTVSTSSGNTTVNNQTQPPSVTPASLQNSSTPPSTNATPLTTSTPVNPTTAPSTTSHTFTAVPASGASLAIQPSASTHTSLTTSLHGNQTTPGGALTFVNCNISQLCSNDNAYFWISIHLRVGAGNETDIVVRNWVSNAFGCRGDEGDAARRVNSSIDFCLGGRLLQAAQVNCNANSDRRTTTCAVLLQLSRAVSVCELQHVAVSALQQHEYLGAVGAIGEVERVGRNVCGDLAPPSGGFVRCTSTSSLDDICRANKPSTLTCSLVGPNSDPSPQLNTASCSRKSRNLNPSGDDRNPNPNPPEEAPRFCDCSAFCNSTRQFYAIRININSSSVNVDVLRRLLFGRNVAGACNTMSGSACQDILRRYQRLHLECHGTQQRLYSCMVILEMSAPVNGCSLNKLLQHLIGGNNGITTESQLTRMAVCGPPGSTVPTLLASNLTWVASDLQTSDVCQPDPTLLKCEANESLAVLLTDGCPPEPPTTNQSTSQPSNQTNSNITTTPMTNSTTNHTTEFNTTAPEGNRNFNGTGNTTISTNTASPNHTAMNNVTMVNNGTNNFTTAENITTTTDSQNNGTLNATASTNNSTADNVTTVFDNATKPAAAPPNNQMGNHTTESVTHNVTTTNTTDNFTTAANQTTGIGFNVSSTASSLTNLTTNEPGVSSTTTPVQTPMLTNTTTTPETSETTVSQEVLEEQADELLNQTQDVSQIDTPQMTQFLRNLEKILEGPTISEIVAQKTINIISNLMEADAEILAVIATSLIRLVDELGIKLALTSEKVILSARLLVLAVKEVDGTNFPTTSIDIFSTDNVQLRGRSRSRVKRSGSPLGSVFLPSSLTTGLSPEQQQEASRVQFNYYAIPVLFQDATLDEQTLVSPVLACSVANMSISNLTENIRFTIQNINPINVNYTATCAFWDFAHNGGGGGWRSDGCFLVNTTPEETTCSCNHLTSFAILLDLSREGLIDSVHTQILTFITYIGCGISAIFLAVTLLTYLSFHKLLRDIPAKILVQLCTALLFLNLVFLVDGWLALYPAIGLCISTAFFLHYFLLASFTWAGLEALHMYLSIVRVFTPYLSRYMLKISLIGWGLPLLVVIIIIAVDKDNYGLVTYGRYRDGTSSDFCWLRNDIAFYVGVVAYFLLIFVLCLLVFIVVLVQLHRIKKQNPQNQAANRGVMTDMRSIAGLVILLGLTWGFALFAWGPLYIPFVYLFSIFNSLQGFFVFVFHCAVKDSVHRQWRIYLCCGKLRLAENSDWSRTATHRNRNLSSVSPPAASTPPQFTSRSISVTSDSTNSSDSVFADSGISEGSNNDSLINEIHRQTLLP